MVAAGPKINLLSSLMVLAFTLTTYTMPECNDVIVVIVEEIKLGRVVVDAPSS